MGALKPCLHNPYCCFHDSMQGKGLADKGKFTEQEVAAMENVE